MSTYINLDLLRSPKIYLKYPDRVRVFLLHRNSAVNSTQYWLNIELTETLIFSLVKIITALYLTEAKAAAQNLMQDSCTWRDAVE